MNRPLIVLLLTIILDSAGIGLVTPVIPALLRELSRSDQVAGDYGNFLAAYAAMQFLFSPILGVLSDRYGRRPILLISLLGAAVDYLVMASASSLSTLFIGRMIAGVTGANVAVATAYIADVSTEDERPRRYGYMNACFGLGLIAGPLLGGLAGSVSPRMPFVLASVLNGMNFLLGYFVLPESHLNRAGDGAKRSLNPFASLAWVLNEARLVPLLTIFGMMYLVGQVPGTLWVIYGEDRFGWDTQQIGVSLAAFGVLHALSQAFMTGPITARLGGRRSIILGVVMDCTGYVLMALATRGWMVFPIMVFLAGGGIAMPALQALLADEVAENKQGELQGTLVSLISLTSVVGPVAVTRAYASVAHSWPGTVWIGGAALYAFCLPALTARSLSGAGTSGRGPRNSDAPGPQA